jgi:hypothetical protein
VTDNNILTVDLLFDQKMDSGFQTIVEDKMKYFDLKGITKAIKGQTVDTKFKLENKELESNFTRYIKHTLGDTSGGVTDILIKFPEELKMEIYFA